MILTIIIEDQSYTLKLEESFLQQASGFFDKMDADLASGWQIGRDWIESPNLEQRLTIVADKLYTAIENNEQKTGMMMAGYIASRAPGIDTIEMDITGEMGHLFEAREDSGPTATTPPPAPQARTNLNKMDALTQAGKEVSRVFKSGKHYKFSLYNNTTGEWEESPSIADKNEAEKLREFAFKKRFDELSGHGQN